MDRDKHVAIPLMCPHGLSPGLPFDWWSVKGGEENGYYTKKAIPIKISALMKTERKT